MNRKFVLYFGAALNLTLFTSTTIEAFSPESAVSYSTFNKAKVQLLT